MKVSTQLILTVLVTLGSFSANAGGYNIEHHNLEANICLKCMGYEFNDGKIEASILINMKLMVQDGEKLLNEIIHVGDVVGQSSDNSRGLIKYIGEREHFAEMALNEMKTIEKSADALNTEKLDKAFTRMSHLLRKVRAENEAAQRTADKLFFGSK